MVRRCTGAHGEQDRLLTCVRWDVPSLCSARQSEERMQERGVSVAPAPINRWFP
jgi:transposase-like protein